MKLLLVGHPKANNETSVACGSYFQDGFVVNLPDPQTGEKRDYLYLPNSKSSNAPNRRTPQDAIEQADDKGGTIYEIQHVQNAPSGNRQRNGQAYGSYFVDSQVVSDGNLYISSQVDPLFFVLPSVASVDKWMPLDQILSSYPSSVQMALSAVPGEHHQLRNLMDFNDKFGADLMLHRFSESRTISWLKSKYALCTDAIRKKMIRQQEAAQRKMGLSQGAFAPSFSMSAESSSVELTPPSSQEENEPTTTDIVYQLDAVEEIHVKQYALQLLCEYLNEDWRKRLLVELEIPSDSLEEKKKEKTGTGSEAEKLLQYTMGNGASNANDDNTPDGKKRKTEPAQTSGLKKLAKVNTKGMKSLTSFFTKKK